MRSVPFVLLSAILFIGCAAPVDDASEELLGSSEETSEAALTAAVPPLPQEVLAALASHLPPANAVLDRLHTVDHYVPIGPGRRIHITETFTLRSLLRVPHRTILMLPGPLTTGDFFQIDVEGYRARDMLARRGFFAVTADFEGTGKSTYPADGRSITTTNQAAAMHKVVQYLQLARQTTRIDVLGESWGGGVAAELCADKLRVRSCVLASMLYKTPSSYADMTFRSPEFKAMLDSLPNGYLQTAPPLYADMLSHSLPAVQAWSNAHLPGSYTTGPLYSVFDLPFFDPTIARVPGLIVQGELDPNQSIDDALDLVHDYGSTAQLVVIPGAGHIPRIEPAPKSTAYWSAVLGFLDP